MNHEVFAALGEALSRGEEAALVTIVSSNGSTPQRVGAKMLVFGDGRLVGTIGGGCYENDAFGKAREAILNRRPQLVHYPGHLFLHGNPSWAPEGARILGLERLTRTG